MNLAINQLLKLFGLSAFYSALIFSGPVFSVDFDRDTLPDDWELANGRDPTVAGYQISHRHNQACVLDDAFPKDATEAIDTDGDGIGDNLDAAPLDATVQKIGSRLPMWLLKVAKDKQAEK